MGKGRCDGGYRGKGAKFGSTWTLATVHRHGTSIRSSLAFCHASWLQRIGSIEESECSGKSARIAVSDRWSCAGQGRSAAAALHAGTIAAFPMHNHSPVRIRSDDKHNPDASTTSPHLGLVEDSPADTAGMLAHAGNDPTTSKRNASRVFLTDILALHTVWGQGGGLVAEQESNLPPSIPFCGSTSRRTHSAATFRRRRPGRPICVRAVIRGCAGHARRQCVWMITAVSALLPRPSHE